MFGSKGVGVLVAHGKDSSEPLMGTNLTQSYGGMLDNTRDFAEEPCKC